MSTMKLPAARQFRSFLTMAAFAICFALAGNSALAMHSGHKHAKGMNDKTTTEWGAKAIDKWTTQLQTKLDLNKDQTSKVHDILMDARNDIQKMRTDFQQDKAKSSENVTEDKKADFRKKIDDRVNKAADDIRGVLTSEDQKAKFAKIETDVHQRIEKMDARWSGDMASVTHRGGKHHNNSGNKNGNK